MALATVGNLGGKLCVVFSDPAGEDSGSISFDETPTGYKSRTFQLVLSSDASNFSITVFGTLDRDTAAGLGTAWEPLPAPSTETSPSYSNPMTDAPGTRLFLCAAPLLAVRFTSDPNASMTGTATVLLLAAN